MKPKGHRLGSSWVRHYACNASLTESRTQREGYVYSAEPFHSVAMDREEVRRRVDEFLEELDDPEVQRKLISLQGD